MDMDMQVQRVTELEGLLHENQIDTPQIRKLQEKNDELWLQLQQWERVYHKEKILAASELKTQQDELLNELEYLLAVSEDEIIQRQEQRESASKSEHIWTASRRSEDEAENDSYVTRIKELEAICTQKDQTINSLKAVLEHQESVFNEKLKIVTAKYDQVKAINLALQVLCELIHVFDHLLTQLLMLRRLRND
ncbi:uncharacterized protein CCR75_005193 [Bremia lactucae]|uniref:Uncharacterized protein n=1 Tax=Bremia lactucae TaxID=4779 RepID=A0A976FGX2_BRELC|nr:hypothetical protein CCR75_005193 [Bremia lactucae]